VIGEPLIEVDECESTQLLLGPDDPEGAVAVADYQSGGRGRLGRSWVAPPGTALQLSILLRPPPERNIAQVSLVGGLAAAEVVEEELGLWRSAQIKWPNDVMVNRRKVAGVLGEARDGVVVLGIGINVNQTREQLPEDAVTPPASLRTISGREHDRTALLTTLLGRLDDVYGQWRSGGLEVLYGELGARDFVRGRRLMLDGRAGTGVMVLRDGRLQVAFDDGETTAVESGELLVER
jgi:BirA family biotin operon repressor/biotin-[acetyl-CoA-carboxylase] ligase